MEGSENHGRQLRFLLVLLFVLDRRSVPSLIALIAMLAIIGIIYKEKARRIWGILIELLDSMKQAKVGKLEVHIENEKFKNLSDKVWVQILLTDLRAKDVSLLLSIFKADKLTQIGAVKDGLRIL
jgi:hypothetical protein